MDRWKEHKTHENKGVKKEVSYTKRGCETDDHTKIGTVKIHPISPLSALLVITSLSCDGEKDYLCCTVVWENSSVPPPFLNQSWQADQHHNDLMFPSWMRNNVAEQFSWNNTTCKIESIEFWQTQTYQPTTLNINNNL